MAEFDFEMDEYLPLRDVVFNTLRKAILTGELRPGERLLEIQLSEKLGVSRTPIREAIRKLELEGLVNMIPRRGAEVASITESDLKDVLEVRRNLDALCAELACERITQKELTELKAACARFESVVPGGDVTSIAAADVAFHNIIIEATGNKRLIQLINNLSESIYRYRLEHIKDKKQHASLVEEHRKIYEAIASGNRSKAAKASTEHIINQEKYILALILEEKK